MRVGSWIRWQVSRIRSCADKLEGGRERDPKYSERPSATAAMTVTANKLGLRLLLLLAAVVMAARALPPQTSRQTSNDEKKREASCEDSELDCLLSTY